MPEPEEVVDYASKPSRKDRRYRWQWIAPTDLLWIACITIILVVIVLPHLGRPPSRVIRQHVTEVQIENLAQSLWTFHDDNGRYPTQAEGLDALIHQPPAMPGWHQLLEDLPYDGWGNEIRYEFPGKKNLATFDLRSAGNDGIMGTADDITK